MNMTTFKKVKIKNIAEINPDALGRDFKCSSIDYVDISSVGVGTLSDTQKLNIQDAPSRAKRLVNPGDTILSTVRPNRRSFFYFNNPKENTVVSTGFAVLRALKNNDSRYLYYSVTEQSFTDYLTKNAKGSAYPAVDAGIIYDGEIYIPEKTEDQTRIASVLSAYDDLIENNEKRIKALEEMAQLLYTEWFVKFNFPVNSPPLEGWQAKPDGVVSSPPEAGCLKGGVVSPRNTQNYMSLPYNPKLKERAKELRKAGNLSEVLFWQQVKNGQFKGFDFDRQKIIGNYIVDFYCSLPHQASPATPSKKGNNSPLAEGCPQGGVVIEIDGSSHDDKQDYDKERDIYLSSLGLTVVHILDSEVKKNLEGVMVWLNDHPAFQAPVQELPPRLSGTPPKEGNNSPSLKGWQAKPDGVVGYKDAGGKMVDSGTENGMVPEGWEVKTVESLLGKVKRKPKIQTGEYLNSGLFPVVDQGKDFIAGYTNDKDTVYEEDLIVFGDHTRCLKYCNFPFACGADGTQLLLTNDTDRMPQILLFFALTNADLQNYNYARHFKFLKALKVLKPDLATAKKFNGLVKQTYEQIKRLRQVNFELSKIRDLLIPQLVTGKRELK